jgi:hypothetical protein
VADGPSTLAKKRKHIPTSESLFRKSSSVDKQSMRRRDLKEDDPRRINRNLAPQEPLSSQVLVKEKISRF